MFVRMQSCGDSFPSLILVLLHGVNIFVTFVMVVVVWVGCTILVIVAK